LISNMLFGDVASLGLHCETLFNGLRWENNGAGNIQRVIKFS
jgi:hypothetical protein